MTENSIKKGIIVVKGSISAQSKKVNEPIHTQGFVFVLLEAYHVIQKQCQAADLDFVIGNTRAPHYRLSSRTFQRIGTTRQYNASYFSPEAYTS